MRHIGFAELLIDQTGNQTQILFLVSNEGEHRTLFDPSIVELVTLFSYANEICKFRTYTFPPIICVDAGTRLFRQSFDYVDITSCVFAPNHLLYLRPYSLN